MGEHTANGGFTLTHKITHGENVIQEAEWVFDVKANDGSKFEMEHLHKMTMTEESPFYGMVYWYTGRYGKNVERKMTVFFDKINKSILFVPKMKMDTTLTLDGEKISEFVFDNTQAKKHIKFFYSPDAYTKDYLFTDEWEYPGHSGCKWNTELKRGGVSIWNWVGDYSFVNNANKFEIKTMDKIVQTEMSPFYGLDHFYLGRYYKTGGRQRTITYEKKNRNFLLGKLFFENTITMGGEKFSQEKLDTRSTPYTMVWFSQPVRGLFPITRDITGQDEMIVSAWHTPAASDLEFGVTITPDRKVVTKFGWEMAGVKKVYLDVVGNNPWMGDYT